MHASVACSEDYADRFTRPYECMRSFIPGVQQLHKVLAYLRGNNASWVLPENSTSPFVRIIDTFQEVGGKRPHGEIVSLAFETISANKSNTCEVKRGISYCYRTASSVKQINISMSELDFAPRNTGYLPHLTREDLLTYETRIGISTGNTPSNSSPRLPITPPVLGPNQNSLEAVMDTGYITLVGGWRNGFLRTRSPSGAYTFTLVGGWKNDFLRTIQTTQEASALLFGLGGITYEELTLLTNHLSPGARSCEKEGGVPATKKWCVLFPHSFYLFEEDGSLAFQGGTSDAVAFYSGAVDLLHTLYPFMSSTETDAVIRSCAVDSTPAGLDVLNEFLAYVSFLEEKDAYDVLSTFFGTEGVDSVTGVGKADLSCLIADDGSLVLDPRTLIDSSLL